MSSCANHRNTLKNCQSTPKAVGKGWLSGSSDPDILSEVNALKHLREEGFRVEMDRLALKAWTSWLPEVYLSPRYRRTGLPGLWIPLAASASFTFLILPLTPDRSI